MKKLLLLSSFFYLFNVIDSFSQLDSVSTHVYFEQISVSHESSDSLQGDSLLRKIIRTETWVNDLDFFGEIVITAYDRETNYPVDRVKHTLQSVIDNNLYVGGLIKIGILHSIEEGRSYRIEILVRDYQGMNYPIISKLLD